MAGADSLLGCSRRELPMAASRFWTLLAMEMNRDLDMRSSGALSRSICRWATFLQPMHPLRLNDTPIAALPCSGSLPEEVAWKWVEREWGCMAVRRW